MKKNTGTTTIGSEMADILKNFMKRINMRDMIGGICITYGMYLMGKGINHVVSGIVISIVTYYFSKRIYEEKNGKK